MPWSISPVSWEFSVPSWSAKDSFSLFSLSQASLVVAIYIVVIQIYIVYQNIHHILGRSAILLFWLNSYMAPLFRIGQIRPVFLVSCILSSCLQDTIFFSYFFLYIITFHFYHLFFFSFLYVLHISPTSQLSLMVCSVFLRIYLLANLIILFFFFQEAA